MNLATRIDRLERRRPRQRFDPVELAATLADMELSIVGGVLGPQRVASAYPDDPSPFAGLRTKDVLAATLDRPAPVVFFERLKLLKAG